MTVKINSIPVIAPTTVSVDFATELVTWDLPRKRVELPFGHVLNILHRQGWIELLGKWRNDADELFCRVGDDENERTYCAYYLIAEEIDWHGDAVLGEALVNPEYRDFICEA